MTTSAIIDFLLSRGIRHIVALQYAHKPGIAKRLNLNEKYDTLWLDTTKVIIDEFQYRGSRRSRALPTGPDSV